MSSEALQSQPNESLPANDNINKHPLACFTSTNNLNTVTIKEFAFKPNLELPPSKYQTINNERLIAADIANSTMDNLVLDQRKNQVLVIIILIINLIYPGIGTIVIGCTIKDYEKSKWVWRGILQLLLTPLVIGWLWALMTSVNFWNERMTRVNYPSAIITPI